MPDKQTEQGEDEERIVQIDREIEAKR